MTHITRSALIASLLVALSIPAAAEPGPKPQPFVPVPKPQTFVVVARAPVVPAAVVGSEARALLGRAELAIVEASEAYGAAVDAYFLAIDVDPTATPPEPQADFSVARAALDEALRTLGPQDAGRDAALYLAGWLAAEELREDAAMRAFGELTERFPASVYAAESLLRLGEIHFDRGELAPARRAYERLLKLGPGKFYAFGLFKLAWTAYRSDRLRDAWDAFERLVIWTDANPKDGQARGLRPEAVEYLAIIATEPDFDGDGTKDKVLGWTRLAQRLDGSRPHHAEVAERAAAAFSALAEPELAAQAAALAAKLRAQRGAEPAE